LFRGGQQQVDEGFGFFAAIDELAFAPEAKDFFERGPWRTGAFWSAVSPLEAARRGRVLAPSL